ncbi:hypothetical protein P9B95_12995 [Bacillus paralicheniformis]|nr:hypothetical protein [Bacillus paralicheniformis]MEC1299580.1 hypothetical protein [Bacillus paralicheniformis]
MNILLVSLDENTFSTRFQIELRSISAFSFHPLNGMSQAQHHPSKDGRQNQRSSFFSH